MKNGTKKCDYTNAVIQVKDISHEFGFVGEVGPQVEVVVGDGMIQQDDAVDLSASTFPSHIGITDTFELCAGLIGIDSDSTHSPPIQEREDMDVLTFES